VSNATGIDVSNNNGVFDWSAHPDLDFAAAKCVEGPHDGEPMFFDPDFAANWAAMRHSYQNRLVRFAYCFFHPASDPIAQADALTSTVRKHGLQFGDSFWLDLEPYPGLATPDGLPPADVAAAARKFCKRVNSNAPKCRCMVYVDRALAEAGCCEGLDPWRLVLAEYGVSRPTVPAPWKTWHIWQKSGTILDRDVYNGDRAALLDFARMPQSRR
jgi:GH25 family lysozyme M1 (1,4-beta-N-acetylmuramidase)